MSDASGAVRVLVAADQPLLRAGIVACLQGRREFDVLGEVADLEATLRLARRDSPDVVVLDADARGGGTGAVQTLARACPRAHLVVLTASEAADDVLASVEAGAAAYVLKRVGVDEFRQVLRSVAAGGVYAPPELGSVLVQRRTADAPRDPLTALTRREREVLNLVSSGLSDKEIGRRLGLSAKTVAAHLTSVVSKLNLHGRVEAALYGHRLGLGTD